MRKGNVAFFVLEGVSKGALIAFICSLVSCAGTDKPEARSKVTKNVEVTDEDAYLADTTRVAAEESANSGNTARVADSVKKEIKNEQLIKVTNRAMDRADLDESGYLTLEEFLAATDKFRSDLRARIAIQPTEEQKARVTTRLTSRFQEFSGSDELMTKEELMLLIASCAPRIAILRDVAQDVIMQAQ